MMNLMTTMQQQIEAGSFPAFVKVFLEKQYPTPEQVPAWVVEALCAAGLGDLFSKQQRDKHGVHHLST